MDDPERRKTRRDTDRYRETTDRAARVIDEARLIRMELGADGGPESEIHALRKMLKKQGDRSSAPQDEPPHD